MKMKESPVFTKLKSDGKVATNPLKESFTHRSNLKMVLLALFGATMGQGVVWYTGQFYAQSFLENVCKINFDQSRTILIWAILFGTPFFVVFGNLSDKIGRKWIMMTGMLLAVVLYRPIYRECYEISSAFLVDGSVTLPTQEYWELVLLVFVQIIFVTMVYGPIAAFLVELFPTRIRYTSMSLPYHVGNGVFGGLTPFIATLLTTIYTGDKLVGLWYPIIIASVCLVIGLMYLNNNIDPDVND
jgi:MFS family permease